MRYFRTLLVTVIVILFGIGGCSTHNTSYKFSEELAASLGEDDVLVRIDSEGNIDLIDAKGNVGDQCKFPVRSIKQPPTHHYASADECHGFLAGSATAKRVSFSLSRDHKENDSWTGSHTCWYCYTLTTGSNVGQEICRPDGCKSQGH